MDIRYSCNQRDFKRYTTDETRGEFLITGLYKADEVVAVYSHVDRMVTLGCMPVNEEVSIDKGIDVWANFGTHYFLERREIGMFNIGEGGGTVTADGVRPGALPLRDPADHHRGGRQTPAGQPGDLQQAHHQPVHPPQRAQDLPAFDGHDRAGAGQQLEHHAQPHPRAPHGDLHLL